MSPRLSTSIGLAFFAAHGLASDVVYTVSDVTRPTPTSITITGSGFGAGPNTLVFDQFEGGADGAEVDLAKTTRGAWSGTTTSKPVYDPIAHSGSHSIRTWVGDPGSTGQMQLDLPAGTQTALISYWVHIPPGTPFPGDGGGVGSFSLGNSSWKLAWIYGQSYQGGDTDVCLPTWGGYNFYVGGNTPGIGFGDVESRVGTEWWDWNHWMRLTTWLDANTTNPTLPGRWSFQRISAGHGLSQLYDEGTGMQLLNVSDVRTSYPGDTDPRPIFSGNGVAEFRHVHIPGWFRETSPATVRPLYDDIYVAVGANAAARVELGDAATYAAVTTLEIQPHTAWTDGQVSVTLNRGGISDLSGAYLYITDANHVVNQHGIPLPTTVGGNHAPVAHDQSASVTSGTSVPIILNATDADGDVLTYVIKTPPQYGILSGGGTDWSYTLTAAYVGSDVFTFSANDGSLDSNVATVSITVNAASGGGTAHASSSGGSGGGCGSGGVIGLIVGLGLALRVRQRRR